MTKKYFEEDQNANKALTGCFLSVLPNKHSQGYRDIIVRDPNRKFQETFMHFYTNFEHEDEIEIEENKDK